MTYEEFLVDLKAGKPLKTKPFPVAVIKKVIKRIIKSIIKQSIKELRDSPDGSPLRR